MKTVNMQDLDLDTFGITMDGIIHDAHVTMVVDKKAGSDEYTVQCSHRSAIIQMFYLLNAMEPVFVKMCEEMGGLGDFDARGFAGEIAKVMQKTLEKAAGAEEKEDGDGAEQ